MDAPLWVLKVFDAKNQFGEPHFTNTKLRPNAFICLDVMAIFNPNGAGGAHCARTFFGRLFLLKIKVLEGPNFLTFPICLWRTPL